MLGRSHFHVGPTLIDFGQFVALKGLKSKVTQIVLRIYFRVILYLKVIQVIYLPVEWSLIISSFKLVPPRVTITLVPRWLLRSLQICEVCSANSLVGTKTRAERNYNYYYLLIFTMDSILRGYSHIVTNRTPHNENSF